MTEVAERVYTTVDKSEWGPGEWQNEPDKVQWKDEETGLPCLAKRGPLGAWCGYIGVAPGHPYYESDYGDLDIDVHGCLTYADHCSDGPEESSICHVPAPGEPDHVWWLGFDCSHSGDIAPLMAMRDRERGWDWSEPYARYATLHYVRREVRKLATQLHAAGKAGEDMAPTTSAEA